MATEPICLGDRLRTQAAVKGRVGSPTPYTTQEGIYFERWADRPQQRERAARLAAARAAHAAILAKVTRRNGEPQKASARPRLPGKCRPLVIPKDTTRHVRATRPKSAQSFH